MDYHLDSTDIAVLVSVIGVGVLGMLFMIYKFGWLSRLNPKNMKKGQLVTKTTREFFPELNITTPEKRPSVEYPAAAHLGPDNV
ncbi:hypothetical protein TWF694_000415 [Orbilia ellipsospora]|uniref:Uncharacterized protein n=1 Tax=Orbilia ellipsospora TaxID=2528407 RepID=A0AAV9XV68_9PEZI